MCLPQLTDRQTDPCTFPLPLARSHDPTTPDGLEQTITVDCVGDSGCKIALGSGDDPGCRGTVLIDCDNSLDFYEADGKLKYCDHSVCNSSDDNGGYDDGGRVLLLLPEDEDEASEDEAKDAPVDISSGSLRGTKGSNVIAQ